MKAYKWVHDGRLLQTLLDEGARVICYDDEYELVYAEKTGDNEYLFGPRHVCLNGNTFGNDVCFLEPA